MPSMRRSCGRSGAIHGMTLIEFVVMLTLFAVVVALGIPSMRDFVVRTSVTTATHALVEAFRTARLEAVTRNVQVTVCKTASPPELPPVCTGAAAEWPEGWVVYVDEGTVGSFDAEDRVIARGRAEGKIDTVLEAPGRLASITFNPVGPITGAVAATEIRLSSSLTTGTFERVICLSVLGRASAPRTGVCDA